MTIERQWLEIMKIEVPDAFTPTAPFTPSAGFIDAQIKLMAMPPDGTWATFLHRQFVQPVTQMFRWGHTRLAFAIACCITMRVPPRRAGAATVVLAFDDYEYVPRAKAITQARRRARLTPLAFSSSSPLPDRPPTPWPAAMASRAFKAMVVELVILSLPDLIPPASLARDAPTTLIIDWRGETCDQWTWDAQDPTAPPRRHTVPRAPLGEADVKFPHWARRLGVPMVADAIDGDYVPIALRDGGFPPLAIARWELGAEVPRTTEWLQIDLLREGLRRAMRMHDFWPTLVVLIGLTGTDYSRNLPLVKPKKLWMALRSVAPLVPWQYHQEGAAPSALDPVRALDAVVATIYCRLFTAHTRAVSATLATTLASMTASRLAPRTKTLLPSLGRALCTLKNANFLLQYWGEAEPDSMDPRFGFRVDATGAVDWDEGEG